MKGSTITLYTFITLITIITPGCTAGSMILLSSSRRYYGVLTLKYYYCNQSKAVKTNNSLRAHCDFLAMPTLYIIMYGVYECLSAST